MTTPIGKGTCNFPVNMDRAERALWGREAMLQDKSLGRLFRDAAYEWAREHRPELAAKVAAIRSRVYKIARAKNETSES